MTLSFVPSPPAMPTEREAQMVASSIVADGIREALTVRDLSAEHRNFLLTTLQAFERMARRRPPLAAVGVGT
jgi:hypothetical protein